MFGEEIVKGVLDIANKYIPDGNKKAEFEAEYRAALLAADTQLAVAQTEVNKVEAGSQSIFIAGWRPAAGWVCSIALGYHFILQPLLAFIFAAFNHPIDLPVFDMNSLYTILFGMLGLGGYRMAEKIKGVA